MDKVIIANWKTNPATLAEAKDLFDFSVAVIAKYPSTRLIICPPFVYLEELAKRLYSFQVTSSPTPPKQLRLRRPGKFQAPTLGSQDLSGEGAGPQASELSADRLKNLGVSHVLVGHSDRRYKIGETDEVINKKVKAALDAGITPVLLVGERSRGDDRSAVLEQQLSADLTGLTGEQVSKVLIAYEPVWAISTTLGAEPDIPANTLTALEIIRKFLAANFQFPISNFQLLYGGSINDKNIVDFLKHPEISGAVIGAASLHKEEFVKILEITSDHD